MKKIIFKTNDDYFKFFNKFKDNIIVYSLDFTKKMQIRLFYDIMYS